MKFIFTFFVLVNAFKTNSSNLTDKTGKSKVKRKVWTCFLEMVGISRITTIIRSYDKWVEDYGGKYKKLTKLTRAIERVRKYVSQIKQSRLVKVISKISVYLVDARQQKGMQTRPSRTGWVRRTGRFTGSRNSSRSSNAKGLLDLAFSKVNRY